MNIKLSLVILILMASATYAQCSQAKDVDMLVTASKLKNSGFVDGQTVALLLTYMVTGLC